MPLNDVMSPVLAAYFEGKRMREDRELKQNQQLFQQQKLAQEQEQFKAELEARKQDLADRVQGRKDTLDYNKSHLKLLQTQIDHAAAVADSNLSKSWLDTLTERTGRPSAGSFNMPMMSPRGTGPMSGMDTKVNIPADKFAIPNRPDLAPLDVTNVPDVPYAKQVLLQNAETNQQRAEDTHKDREAALKSGEYQKEQDRLSREYIAKIVAQNRELVAGLHGKDTAKRQETISKHYQTQLNNLNNTPEAKSVLASSKAAAAVDDIWNRSGGDAAALSENDAINLVYQYLNTVTPGNRITDFEFKTAKDADSKLASFKQKISHWFKSGSMTPAVAKSLMGEIKTAHENGLKFYNERYEGLTGSAEALAAGNGIDSQLIRDIGEAAKRKSFQPGAKNSGEKKEEKKVVKGDPSTYREVAAP